MRSFEFQYLMLTSIGDGRLSMREILEQGKVLLRKEYFREPRVAASIAISLASAYKELGDAPRQLEMLMLADTLATASKQEATQLTAACARISYYSEQRPRATVAALIDTIRPNSPKPIRRRRRNVSVQLPTSRSRASASTAPRLLGVRQRHSWNGPATRPGWRTSAS